MSKLFNGNYTRLDDNMSFQLLRTNPMLTGNVKIFYNDEDIYLESFDANTVMSSDKYKAKKVSGNNPYDKDLRQFFADTNDDSIFEVYHQFTDKGISPSLDYQFETEYWTGAESINSKVYDEELGFFAPLYLRDKLPNYFVIFKVATPTNWTMNTLKDNDPNNDYPEFDFKKDVLEGATILKSFDLRENTKLGKYIRQYIGQTTYEKNPMFVNFSTKKITYTGIKLGGSGFKSVSEDFEEKLLKSDTAIQANDEYITKGFYRNGLIYPNILNLEFLFDDDETSDYEFGRYFGMYCNDIDLFEFEGTHNDSQLVCLEPQYLTVPTIITAGTEKNKIEYNDSELSQLSISNLHDYADDNVSCAVYYLKDKNNGLHRVISNDNDEDKSALSISDVKFDFSSITGFETETVSAYCERVDELAKSTLAFTLNLVFESGETIDIIFDDKLLDTIIADSSIETGKSEGNKFSCNGTVADNLIALASCFNSLTYDTMRVKAYYSDTDIVIQAFATGALYNGKVKLQLDKDIIANNKTTLNNGYTEYTFDGGTNDEGRTFKILASDVNMFVNGRYIVTSLSGICNAKILFTYPYVDSETGKIDTDYCTLVTDEYGKQVEISTDSQVEIVDRYYPRVGLLSFMPVRDFDTDTLFSTYAVNDAFAEECYNMGIDMYNRIHTDDSSESDSESSDEDDSINDEFTKSTLWDKYMKDRFSDYNGSKCETEYEYFLENYNPDFSTLSKTVPYIDKWVYFNGAKDICENPYRLNMSKIFGTNNFSSNNEDKDASFTDSTLSVPYFLTGNKELVNSKNQYLYIDVNIAEQDIIGGDTTNIEYYEQLYEKFFLDTEVDNFEKLFMIKSNDSSVTKTYDKKYSIIDGGTTERFAETLFRGAKFCVKDVVDEKEFKSSKYNGYRFSFIYIPVDLSDIHCDGHIHIVKNDTFKFIVMYMFVNTIYGINSMYPDKFVYPLTRDNFSKSTMYGAANKLYTIVENKKSEETSSRYTIKKLPFNNIFETDGESFKKLFITDLAVQNMFYKIENDRNSIEKQDDEKLTCVSISIYNNDFKETLNGALYDIMDNGLYLSYDGYKTKTYIDYSNLNDCYVDITFRNINELFEDFYDAYSQHSICNIKYILSENEYVEYASTSDDEFSVTLIDYDTLYTRDVNTYKLVRDEKLSSSATVTYSEISSKGNVDDLCLMEIHRYSGNYEPSFRDVLYFNDFVYDGNTYHYSNTSFNYDYEDLYAKFGVIKNLYFHKVCDADNSIVSLTNAVYPLIGQYALDNRDMNIFETSWDYGFYTKYVDAKHSNALPGTMCMKNSKQMFGSKYMNVPEEIVIEDLIFNGDVDETTELVNCWNDSYITQTDLTDNEIMFKEISTDTVKFYIFLEKRLARFFKESPMYDSFKKYVNELYSYGDQTTLTDDVDNYVVNNILKLYGVDKIYFWVKQVPSGSNNKKINNEYVKYLLYSNDRKKINGLARKNTFATTKLVNSNFDTQITYNMRNGYKESFAFSFVIKKI